MGDGRLVVACWGRKGGGGRRIPGWGECWPGICVERALFPQKIPWLTCLHQFGAIELLSWCQYNEIHNRTCCFMQFLCESTACLVQ